MTAFSPGDKVRVTIPDQDDPDQKYHGRVGTITAVLIDDLGQLTGDPADDYIYEVMFDNDDSNKMNFRHQDLEAI